ncbi:MAG: ATP-binding protein, partial [Salibacteraceae bacterium]
MDPKNTRSGGDLSHFDSKIKDLYLKLHDFSFFHSPSGLQKPDARFVGREKIIRKLVNILSNSETKAGAYLVTGYRGVGKTSLVRKALAQLRAEPRLGASKIRWLFLFSFLIGVTGGSRALTDWFTQSWIWLVSAGIPVLALFALMSSYNLLALIRSSDLQNDRKRDLSSTDIVRFFGNLVVLEILKMIFLSVLGEWAGYYTRFLISHSAAFLLLAAVYKVAYLWELAREWQFKNSPSEEKLWKGVWGSIKSQVEFRLKNRSKIPIELSLAQKDLTDRDILRLIAINVYKQYRRVRHPLYSFRKFLWVVGANVFLYVFAAILYYNGFVYQSIQGTWENGVANYLPSQQVWINDSLQNSLNTYYLEADSNGLSFEKYMGYFSMPEVSAISDSLPQVLKWQQQANYIVNQFGEPTTQRSKARNSIKRITWRLDFFITSLFHSVVDGFKGRVVQINDGTQKKKKAQKDANRQFVLHSNFSLLPRFPDYLFFIFYGFIVGGFHLVKRLLPAMGVETHRSVVRQLKVLNARIEANVSLGEEQNSGWSRGGFGLGLLRSIRRTFPIATAREIETELIEIFNLIDRIPSLAFRPEFIFILDELDKVEVHGELFRSGDSEQEKSGPRPAFGPEYTRQKQEAIAGLLGNMKHFLNVAKAKFIFIASREMYDVSLADISDRDSYIGSVFHEVLHVPSFFTDSYQTDSADVTRLTEEYVCQFLVPRHGKYANSLEGYYQYLSQEVFVVAHGEQDRVRCQWQLQKVIFTLQNFIVYLTYRSNGKPKYLTRYC